MDWKKRNIHRKPSCVSYIKKNANRKPPEGASMSRYVKRSLTKQYKYLPVILERSEESGQRIRVLNTLFAIILCRILRDHSSRCGSVLLIRILPPLKNDGRGAWVFLWYSDLCTPTCPYRLARLGTSPCSGEADTKEERIIVLKVLTIKWLYKENKEKFTNCKPSPLVG